MARDFILVFVIICYSSLLVAGLEDCPNVRPVLHAPNEIKGEEPPKVGNFSLPTSQQPAALFGFGGNIIDKNEVQLYFFADEFVGKDRITIDLIPSVLYGVTEHLSIYFNAPFTPLIREGRDKSSGLEDFFIQMEYAFYDKKTASFADQATFVGNITAPTGSIQKNPPTGFGSPSLFLGATYFINLGWGKIFRVQKGGSTPG
jgi:hypothetical protein